MNVLSVYVDQFYGKFTWTNPKDFRFLIESQGCDSAAIIPNLKIYLIFLHWLDLDDAKIRVIAHGQKTIRRVNTAKSLSPLISWGFLIALDLDKSVWLHILSHFEGIESIAVFGPSHKIILHDVGLIEFMTVNMIFFHIAVIFVLSEFFQSFDDVGEDLDFFLFGKLRVEVVGFKGLFQKR